MPDTHPTLTAANVALERAFAHLISHPSDEFTNRLRDAVWVYVDHMRSQGAPPERMLVDLKAIARRAGLSYTPSNEFPSLDAVRTRALRSVIEWSIDRYFSEDGSRPSDQRPDPAG